VTTDDAEARAAVQEYLDGQFPDGDIWGDRDAERSAHTWGVEEQGAVMLLTMSFEFLRDVPPTSIVSRLGAWNAAEALRDSGVKSTHRRDDGGRRGFAPSLAHDRRHLNARCPEEGPPGIWHAAERRGQWFHAGFLPRIPARAGIRVRPQPSYFIGAAEGSLIRRRRCTPGGVSSMASCVLCSMAPPVV
jgi:hypothetical protein